ncbi:MAG: metallophosphoesterase, partial [Verrucomicrobiae bacterium]|nr:metallophosphoesterase [Verrucomicrobiae bacterium]
MPKVALLFDIHGNLPALIAVLKRVMKSGAEEIVFGGDIVGYGASPAACVDLVRKLGGHCVLGNHDAYTKKIADDGEGSLYEGWGANPVWAGVVHAVRQLDRESLAWLWDRPWFLHL